MTIQEEIRDWLEEFCLNLMHTGLQGDRRVKAQEILKYLDKKNCVVLLGDVLDDGYATWQRLVKE